MVIYLYLKVPHSKSYKTIQQGSFPCLEGKAAFPTTVLYEHVLRASCQKEPSWPYLCPFVWECHRTLESTVDKWPWLLWRWWTVVQMSPVSMICSNASSTCTDPKVCSGSGHIQPISSFFHKNPRVRLHIRTSPFPPAYWVTMGEGHAGGDPRCCQESLLSKHSQSEQGAHRMGWTEGGSAVRLLPITQPMPKQSMPTPGNTQEFKSHPTWSAHVKKTKTKKPCSVNSLAWQLTRADVFKKEVAVWEFNIMWKKREGEGSVQYNLDNRSFCPYLKTDWSMLCTLSISANALPQSPPKALSSTLTPPAFTLASRL